MTRHPLQILKRLTALLTAVALLSVGFAHRAAQTDLPEDLAAYVAAGGSLADICGEVGGDGASAADCEACRVADNLQELRAPELRASGTCKRILASRFVAKTLARSRGLDPARAPRAPPQA